jgi:Pyruvate/2-oxoglutarate dehydrogenase complex, dihydrolipoamide acyltransferase (E2) component, and related enzymes
MALREKFKDKFKEKHGVGLGFMSFFVKAVVEALKAFPTANARLDGADIVQQHFYDIGVAVSTDRGLMVPIVRDADGLSLRPLRRRLVSWR